MKAGIAAIHKDPFDRLLVAQAMVAQAVVAQAMVEGVTLLTADPVVGRYPASVSLV